MPDSKNAAPATGRRDFVRRSAAAALVLPAIVSGLGACAETRAGNRVTSAPDSLPPVPSPALARRAQADAMDAMHEKGIKAFPAKTAGKGNQLHAAAHGEGRQGLRAHRERDRSGRSSPGRTVEGVGVQRSGARAADPRARGRPRPRESQERAARVHRDSLPRSRAADRPGRRAVHHAAAGQAGRVVHLRVHGAERRLAHVPLAPQRGASRSGIGLLGRVHRRAEASPRHRPGRRGLRDGAQRRRRTATR